MPEWPLSPLRLFQALVANGVGREVYPDRREAAVAALRALERSAPPEIIAPAATEVTPLRAFVPDNTGDRVAKAWSAGRKADLAEFRTEKDVRPLRLDGEAVQYVFRDARELQPHVGTIRRLARSLTHLGWGIDMVAGDAELSGSAVEGERWIPGRPGGTTLRLPIEGTFDDLERKHAQFLQRLESGTFRPVAPLHVFETKPYARATDPLGKRYVAFRLLEPATDEGLWLDPMRRSRDVAAWTRHTVAEICKHWPFGPSESIVHGHVAEADGSRSLGPRFSYLPLPTLNPRLGRVEGIRRVLVCAPHELARELEWVGKYLGGELLRWHEHVMAVLEPLPGSDWVLRQYVARSDLWATVTPVVLPGHDDRSPTKAESLLRKAFRHAGFEDEVIDEIVELEWRKSGFIPGTEHANRYVLPDKVQGPTFHVRVRFKNPVAGPLSVGSGRHRGLGVFVAKPAQ